MLIWKKVSTAAKEGRLLSSIAKTFIVGASEFLHRCRGWFSRISIPDTVRINKAAGKHWDKQLEQVVAGSVMRVRWWEDETTTRHINGIVGNHDLTGLHAAFHERISKFFTNRSNLKAVSVGCGVAAKEMSLMQSIDVARFDLFDVSKASIAAGKEAAARLRLGGRLNLRTEDAFAAPLGADYDLVYWNNSLHHMPNVVDALRWSSDRLKPGGLLAMDDFIGPNRFQWTDENLYWASAVRRNLPRRFLRNPHSPGQFVASQVTRPTPKEVIDSDPSEAADSARIVAAIKAQFAHCEILLTGGALYHLALNDIFCNFNGEDDLALLRQILLLDKALADGGLAHYAVALAVKSTREDPA